MASGSILGSVSGNLQCKVEWSSTSNGSQANTSTIRATVYARRTNTATTTGRSWSGYVAIGGEHTAISFSSSVSVSSSWVEMASKERTVSHNADGTKQITIEGEVTGPSGTTLADNTSYAHQDVWLDTIPRYMTSYGATLTPLLNTATIQWETGENCSAIKYGTNASSLTEMSVSGKSGSFTMTGLSPETNYTFYINYKRADSNLYNPSNSSWTFKTKAIAKLDSVPNIYIGEGQDLTWTNPSGNNVSLNLKLCQTNGTVIQNYGTVTQTGAYITPNANTIYALTPNSNTYTARYVLTTTANGVSYTNYKDFVFTVRNSNPTFSNFTYEDTNVTTTAITGNNQILVNGYSNVTATISTTNKAVAKNGATMTSYTMSIGSQSTNPVAYLSSQVQLSLPKVNSGTVIISAKDSRGNSTTVTKTATFKNYSDLIIKSVTATRSNNGVGKVVTLSYNGTFWNSSFGSTTNTIKTLKYYYKLTTASSWTTGGTTLTKTVSGNNWSGSININGDLGTEGFNISNAYNIRLEVSDELSTKTFDLTLTSGTPAMSIYKGNVAIGKKYDTSQGGVLQIGGKVGGDIYFNNNSSSIIWKENGYGDKFRIIPDFGGADDSNKLKIQGTVGGAGEDPTSFSDLITISAKNGLVQHKDNVTISKADGNTGDTCYYANRTDTGVSVFFGVGSGGTNHGVYSQKLNKWIVYADENNAYLNGNANTATEASFTRNMKNKYTSRPTSANVTTNGDGGLYTFKATSSMTTGKPSNDAHIINFSWDNTGGWDSQLAIIDGAYPKIELRGMNGGTWSAWRYVESRTNLYNNTSGATGTITLNDSAANYSFLRIYARTSSENFRISVDVYSPNGQSAYLIGGWQSGTNINFKAAAIKISGTSITRVSNGFFAIDNGGEASVSSPSDVVAILRVDGYK